MTIKESIVAVIGASRMKELGSIMVQLANEGFQLGRVKSVKLNRSQAPRPDLEGTVVAVEVLGNGCVGRVNELGLTTGAEYDEDVRFFFQSRLASSAALGNCALCIIKPHIIAENAAHQIVEILQREGLDISAIQRFTLDRQAAKEFLDVYFGVLPHANSLVAELCSGPCLAVEVSGGESYERLRTLCGPPDPEIARYLRPNTLRAQYGKDVVRNAVHCTDLAGDGPLESDFMFRTVAASELIKDQHKNQGSKPVCF